MIGIPAVPGFWADTYMCKKDNIVETINYMLSIHASDFPNTACGGFEVVECGELVKIIPRVLINSPIKN